MSHSSHERTVEINRFSTFIDESYFSIFYSPRQLQQLSIVKHGFTVLFILLLGVKLKLNNIPWFTVFFPTFLNNIIAVITIKNELNYVWKTIGANYVGLCRPMAQFLDNFGSVFAKILILCLWKDSSTSLSATVVAPSAGWTIVLIPIWICVGVSGLLRCVPYFPIYATSSYRKKHVLSMIFSSVAFILLRGIQPFLIALRIDGYLVTHRWAVIFAPCWILTFFGLACALLMFSVTPFVNNFTNDEYRVATQRLLSILSLQVAAISVASICFVVLVTQKLDYRDDSISGHNHDNFQVVVPLLALFIFLILSYPIFLQSALKFQHILAVRRLVLQLNRPSFDIENSHNGDSSSCVTFNKIEKITWLMQTAVNGATFKVADAREINPLLENSREKTNNLQVAFHDPPGREQHVHGHLDAANTYTTSNLLHQEDSYCRDVEKTTATAINGDIELGEWRSDCLDKDLPSPCLSPLSHLSSDRNPSCPVTAAKTQSTNNNQDTSEEESYDIAKNRVISPPPHVHQVGECDRGVSPCVICMARPVNTVLMPCGHNIVCLQCALEIGKVVHTAMCPVCRTAISSWFHLQQAPFEVSSNVPHGHNKVHMLRLAVASREYQLGLPHHSTQLPLPHHQQLHAATTIQDYLQHVPAHDALFDILFS